MPAPFSLLSGPPVTPQTKVQRKYDLFTGNLHNAVTVRINPQATKYVLYSNCSTLISLAIEHGILFTTLIVPLVADPPSCLASLRDDCYLASSIPFPHGMRTYGHLPFLTRAVVFTCGLLKGSIAAPWPSPDICKSIPGSSDWPSRQEWNALNHSTGGRLLRPPPLGGICHPRLPNYDAAACPRLRADWSTYACHADDPTAVDWQQYTNDSCLPDEDVPCSGDGYPVYVVNATTADHVKFAVDFGKSAILWGPPRLRLDRQGVRT